MNRRTAALLALAALTALSGCAGFLGADSTETPANATSPTNASAGSQTAVHDLPLNGTAVLDTHEQALTDAGSFTYQANATKRFQNISGLLLYTNKTVQRDNSSGKTWVLTLNSMSPSRETYLGSSGKAYQARRMNRSRVLYGTVDRSYVNVSTFERPPIDPYLAGLNFTHRGTTTVDGVTVDTYGVTDMSHLNRSAHGLREISPENLDEINVTLRIDRSGVIRSFHYTVAGSNAQGDQAEFALSLRYTDVGSTTVTKPEWVTTAFNESG